MDYAAPGWLDRVAGPIPFFSAEQHRLFTAGVSARLRLGASGGQRRACKPVFRHPRNPVTPSRAHSRNSACCSASMQCCSPCTDTRYRGIQIRVSSLPAMDSPGVYTQLKEDCVLCRWTARAPILRWATATGNGSLKRPMRAVVFLIALEYTRPVGRTRAEGSLVLRHATLSATP